MTTHKRRPDDLKSVNLFNLKDICIDYIVFLQYLDFDFLSCDDDFDDLIGNEAQRGSDDFTAVPTILKSSKNEGTLLGSPSFVCCPWIELRRPGAADLLKWKFVTKNNSNIIADMEKLGAVLPIKMMDRHRLVSCPLDNVQITWIGHATVYVQFDGIGILTDPVFGDWCGPKFAEMLKVSYRRYRKAPYKIEDLPYLDAVIISNNHYDHLEKASVMVISSHFKDVKWFVALEQICFLIQNGVNPNNITELDWWNESEKEIRGRRYKFICTPSQHWCRRSVLDTNTVLWCSWVIKGPTKSFYFAGDTGYFEALFKTIGQMYGPFDLAVIPIGGYEPRFITKYQHVDPEEAVKIHRDVRSKQSIGVQWGTFELTNEFYAEPPQKVEEEMLNAGLNPDDFFSLCHGETWCVGEPRLRPPFMDVKVSS